MCIRGVFCHFFHLGYSSNKPISRTWRQVTFGVFFFLCFFFQLGSNTPLNALSSFMFSRIEPDKSFVISVSGAFVTIKKS